MLKLLLLVFASAAALANASIGDVQSFEKLIDGEVEDIQWFRSSLESVIVLTDEGKIYVSHDDGKTWDMKNDGFVNLAHTDKTKKTKKGNMAEDDNLGDVLNMYVSAVDSNYIFLQGYGDYSFYTTDGAKSWKLSFTEDELADVMLHPTDKSAILSTRLAKKCNDGSAEGDCFKSLYISKNFGKTWTYLTHYIVQAEWVHNLKGAQAAGQPKYSIFASMYGSKVGNQKFGYWNPNINFVRTDDEFKTHKVLVKGGNRFLFTSKFLFIAEVARNRLSEVLLKISDNGGKSFYDGKLPFVIKQHSYTVLDTSEDTVFLHVNHAGEDSHFGHVYISDASGMNYSLSLPYNRRAKNGKCDFEKILGLEGIYMANYVENAKEMEEYYERSKKQDMGASSGSGRGHRAPQPRIRSVITYDKGGYWGYVMPPTHDSNAKPIECSSKHCSLHLHGITDDWGPFYSADNALGLIMATGNIGPYLMDHVSDVNTYFSRDAGLTWSEASKGSTIYEFGDHGGLILLANDVIETDVIKYSWTEGMKWNEFKFTDSPISVDNIIIEPSGRGRRFIVYGTRTPPNGDDSVGVMFLLDFSALHERTCKGLDSIGSEESDFEIWSPHDVRLDGKCLLGHVTEYTRRKPDRACYTGIEHVRGIKKNNCACEEDDYECDFGYTRKIAGGPCIRDMNVDLESASIVPAYCPAGGSYSISNGYRKVSGDTCKGGVDRMPSVFPCPGGLFGVSHSGWLVLFIIVCLVVGMGMLTYNNKLDVGGQFGGIGTRDFGDGSMSRGIRGFLTNIKDMFTGGNHARYTPIGASMNQPDSALDFGDDIGDDYGDYAEGFGLDDEEEDEPELMPAETSAKPLPKLFDDVDAGDSDIPILAAPPSSESFGDAV